VGKSGARARLFFGTALASLALLAGAAACGGDEEGEEAGGEAGKVDPAQISGTVSLRGWGNPVEKGLLEQVLDDFRAKYPDIKVNYQVVEGDFTAAMLASFSARKPPDVFYVDSSVAPDWIDQQLLEPLDGYVEANDFSTDPFYDPLIEAFRGPDGNLYGLPKDWSPLGTLTNDAMLEQAGVEPPTNWEELREAAQKLQVPGGKPICLSADWARLMAFVYQNGGSFLNEDKTEVTVNSPEVKEAAEFYVGLVKDGLAALPAQLGSTWCGEALGKEKAAIIFEGNWAIPFFEETYPDVQYGIHPFIRGDEEANMGYTVAYAIAADSKNKDAAWVLLSHLVGQEGMKTWTSKGLALPAREDVEPVSGREPFLEDADVAHGWQLAPKFTTVYDTANNELEAVMEGKQTIDGMLAKTESAAEEALAK
jgi:multiple sugar transport system substrate-binding protein